MALKFTKMTRKAVRDLEIRKQIQEHGIVAERIATGDVRYSINVMVDGQRIHRVVGTEAAGVTREQAERLIEQFRTEAREQRLQLPKGRKLHRTFEESAREYLIRLEQTGGKNLKPKAMHLKRHLTPYFGQERLDQIKELALRTYRVKRLATGAKDATVNRELATFSHLIRSAANWGWIGRDNIPHIPKEREPQEPVFILTETEASSLLEAAKCDADEKLWLFVLFGLGTAMRHREILRVRWEHINLAARRIYIPHAKAGDRQQPMTTLLSQALQKLMPSEQATSEWVFPTLIPGQSKHGHRTNIARQFARAVIRANLDPSLVTPHTMRHTAITRLVEAGIDLPTVQRISGHKTLAMVLRYTHVHGQHIDNAMQVLDAA